ncbi:hypothetical protein, partial [Klebsiella aerogenes]|uniref:hypothetical protein n=1 Tax=Klebsiella aerogenes TaxID=548 RepID=UPI0013D2EF9B
SILSSIALAMGTGVILCDIAPDQKQAIANLLVTHGVEPDPNAISQLVRYSMACPALPTCLE